MSEDRLKAFKNKGKDSEVRVFSLFYVLLYNPNISSYCLLGIILIVTVICENDGYTLF